MLKFEREIYLYQVLDLYRFIEFVYFDFEIKVLIGFKVIQINEL